MIRARAALVGVALAALLIGACKGKRAPARRAIDAGRPADAAVAALAPPDAGPPPLPAITWAEVAPLLPPLRGARVLSAPPAEPGPQVLTAWCLAGSEPPAALERLKTELAKRGWTAIEVVPHPTDKARFGVRARKPPYMASGTVEPGAGPPCDGAKGEINVRLAIYEVPPHP